MKTKKFCLTENQMPAQWYNIVADMPNKPLPPLHPATKQPVTKEQMSAIFAEELFFFKQDAGTVHPIDEPFHNPLQRRIPGVDKLLGSLSHIVFFHIDNTVGHSL